MRSISSSGIPKPHDVLTDLQSLAGDDWVSEDIEALKSYVSILQLGGPNMQETLAQLFRNTVAHGKPEAILTKETGTYAPISSAELDRRVIRLHTTLIGEGLGKGDKVALLSENRWEWAVSDFAMMTAGIVSVPIYPTLPAEQIRYLLDHSESKAVLCSTAEQLAKIQEIRDQLPALNLVAVFDSVEAEGVVGLRSLIGDEQPSAEERARFDAAVDSVEPGSLASIIYTSGTTGVPKGVMLSHYNMASNIRDSLIEVGVEDVALSFLPLCHVAERLADYVYFNSGATVAYAESIDTVAVNMGEVRPTFAVGVPRFFEKVYGRVMAAMADAPPPRRKIFEWAARVGTAATPYRLDGKPLPLTLKLKHRLADKLVFHKLRGRLGGRIKMFVSGAAPLPRHLAEFFYALGLPICEGYGLTETSPLVSINTLEDLKFGSVGKVIPNVEVRIADDGEIVVRGPNIMQGYYKMEQQTAEVMDGDWFHTGDIGEFDEDEFLSITDRKKDMFKTSGGKYIVPAPIENLLKRSPFIETAVVIADQRNFPSALIVPDFPTLRGWAESQGIECPTNQEYCANEQVVERVMSEVSELCSGLAQFERIKKIALIGTDFSIDGGELTPTMKVRRRQVNEKYKDQIEELYG